MEFFSVQIFHDAGFSTERPKTRLSDGIFLFRSCCVTAFVPPEGRKTGLRMEFFFSTFFSCVAGPCVAYLISCGLSGRKVKVFRIKGRKGPLTSKQKKGIRKKRMPFAGNGILLCSYQNFPAFAASAMATAVATVMPTMGLLPAPMRPIISTCAGTEEEPANCASECIRPRVSVMP